MLRKVEFYINYSIIIKAIRILPKTDRLKIIAITILQAVLGFIDLIGVAAMGILGALAVTGIQSKTPGSRISQILSLIGIERLSFQSQIAFLGLCAAGILIFRTIISVLVTKKILYFLSRRSALLTSNLVARLLSQPLTQIQSRTTQETAYALTAGVNSITLGILGATTTVVADISLLIIMILGLFIVDSLIAVTTLLFFGTLAATLYKIMNVKAHNLGYLNSELTIASEEKIIEVLDSYRESVVRNRRNYYSKQIGSLRLEHSNVLAEIQFMPNVSKYVIESGMVVGAVFIAGIQFMFQDAQHAVAALSVFLAAGTRIAPAILRLQQSFIQIKNSKGAAMPALELIHSLSGISPIESNDASLNIKHDGFTSNIKIDSITLRYEKNEKIVLNDINLEIKPGKSVAIVGPSGAGKTSLVDVILGVLPPNSGSVLISGKKSLDAIGTWPGAIAYVPQDIKISNGSIRENVALGFPIEEITNDLVWQALDAAQLSNFVSGLPNQLDTQVGENGAKLSGGQRQRLGIARAMFTKPMLLVLDEATSSLDGQTESDLSESISNLKGTVTVIVIAHRLSTIRNSDEVIYMDGGKIIYQGTFNEVRKAVPDFDRQAELIGL